MEIQLKATVYKQFYNTLLSKLRLYVINFVKQQIEQLKQKPEEQQPKLPNHGKYSQKWWETKIKIAGRTESVVTFFFSGYIRGGGALYFYNKLLEITTKKKESIEIDELTFFKALLFIGMRIDSQPELEFDSLYFENKSKWIKGNWEYDAFDEKCRNDFVEDLYLLFVRQELPGYTDETIERMRSRKQLSKNEQLDKAFEKKDPVYTFDTTSQSILASPSFIYRNLRQNKNYEFTENERIALYNFLYDVNASLNDKGSCLLLFHSKIALSLDEISKLLEHPQPQFLEYVIDDLDLLTNHFTDDVNLGEIVLKAARCVSFYPHLTAAFCNSACLVDYRYALTAIDRFITDSPIESSVYAEQILFGISNSLLVLTEIPVKDEWLKDYPKMFSPHILTLILKKLYRPENIKIELQTLKVISYLKLNHQDLYAKCYNELCELLGSDLELILDRQKAQIQDLRKYDISIRYMSRFRIAAAKNKLRRQAWDDLSNLGVNYGLY